MELTQSKLWVLLLINISKNLSNLKTKREDNIICMLLLLLLIKLLSLFLVIIYNFQDQACRNHRTHKSRIKCDLIFLFALLP